MNPWRSVVAALAAAVVAAPLAGQQPLGPELQANGYTPSYQVDAQVEVAPDGTFVVAWTSDGSYGSDDWASSIQARRFDADGTPRDVQFEVNEYTSGVQFARDVLIDEEGEFKVVWSDRVNGPGFLEIDGKARRFAADGSALGSEFLIAGSFEYSSPPATSGRPDGSFVMARDSYGAIGVGRFSATGAVQGYFTVAGGIDHYLTSAGVAVAPAGEFVVAWVDTTFENYLPVDQDLWMQRYDAGAVPVGGVIDVVGPGGAGSPYDPVIARNGAGGFLVVWAATDSAGGDTSFSSIHGRVFDAQGLPLGPSLQVNDRTPGTQWRAKAAAAPDGSFVVVWEDYPETGAGGGDGSESSIRARHLSADGTPRGSSFAVNSFTTGRQVEPSVAVFPSGDFLFAWSSEVSGGNDASGPSIQIRRFLAALFADGFEGGDTLAWSLSSP